MLDEGFFWSEESFMSCVHFLIYPEKLSSSVTSRKKPCLSPAALLLCSCSVSHRAVQLFVWLSCTPPPAPGFHRAGSLPYCLCTCPSVWPRECAGLNDRTESQVEYLHPAFGLVLRVQHHHTLSDAQMVGL